MCAYKTQYTVFVAYKTQYIVFLAYKNTIYSVSC